MACPAGKPKQRRSVCGGATYTPVRAGKAAADRVCRRVAVAPWHFTEFGFGRTPHNSVRAPCSLTASVALRGELCRRSNHRRRRTASAPPTDEARGIDRSDASEGIGGRASDSDRGIGERCRSRKPVGRRDIAAGCHRRLATSRTTVSKPNDATPRRPTICDGPVRSATHENREVDARVPKLRRTACTCHSQCLPERLMAQCCRFDAEHALVRPRKVSRIRKSSLMRGLCPGCAGHDRLYGQIDAQP